MSHRYFLNEIEYSRENPIVTGAAIMANPNIDPTYMLFLEGEGRSPDTYIHPSDSVDLSVTSPRRFHTTPKANF